MFLLVLKPDGLLPYECSAGDIVSINALETTPLRVPTYQELYNNLTVKEGRRMLSMIGVKNTSKNKNAMMTSIIRDWERIGEWALAFDRVCRKRDQGKVKMLGFSNGNGYHFCLVSSGTVFALDALKQLLPVLPTEEMVMTMTAPDMKFQLTSQGWTGNAFKNKAEMCEVLMDYYTGEFEATVNEPDDGESSDESEGGASDEPLDMSIAMIDELVAMHSAEDTANFLCDASEFYDTVKYAIVQSCKNQTLFTVKYDGTNSTVGGLKTIVVNHIQKLTEGKGYDGLQADDFDLVCGCVRMKDENLMEHYAKDFEIIPVEIHFKLRGGGKPVLKKNEKVAITRSKCSANASKTPAGTLDEATREKYNTTYKMLMNDSECFGKMVGGMSAESAERVLKSFEEGKVKVNTLTCIIDEVVPDYKALIAQKDYYTHIVESFNLAFGHAMTEAYYDETKGKLNFDPFKDLLKAHKVRQEERKKNEASNQGAPAPMQT